MLSTFAHPHFRRGRPDLLHLIVASKASKAKSTETSQPAGAPHENGGGLVASLRARVSALEEQLSSKEQQLLSLQELFHRVTGVKRGRDDSAETGSSPTLGLDRVGTPDEGALLPDGPLHHGRSPACKRPRMAGPHDLDLVVNPHGAAPATDPVGQPTPPTFLPTASFDMLCDAVCRNESGYGSELSLDVGFGGAAPSSPHPGTESEPGPEEDPACDSSSVISDLGSQDDPASLDLDALACVMSECSLSLDSDSRALTLDLDLDSVEGTPSLGLAAVHSVTGTSESGVISVGQERSLMRTDSYELMRKLLNALPATTDSGSTQCSSAGGEGAGVLPGAVLGMGMGMGAGMGRGSELPEEATRAQ